MTKQEIFSELSIKIAILEMKLDKVLELLNKPELERDYALPDNFDDENPTNWGE